MFFLSCLEVVELVPDQAAKWGRKRGKKSVLFLLINRAIEEGSVFHSVALRSLFFPLTLSAWKCFE